MRNRRARNLWMIFHILAFADYPLYSGMYATGFMMLIAGLWLLKRSHEDLDTNSSVSLELKENHKRVENGVYQDNVKKAASLL